MLKKRLYKYITCGRIRFEGKYTYSNDNVYSGHFSIYKTDSEYYRKMGQVYVLCIGFTSPVYCSLSALNEILLSWNYETLTKKDWEQ